MCQGIRDAANLAWKLVAAITGESSHGSVDELLDSCEVERSAHVRALTLRIKAIGAVICERDEGLARVRDAQLLDAGDGQVVDTPRLAAHIQWPNSMTYSTSGRRAQRHPKRPRQESNLRPCH